MPTSLIYIVRCLVNGKIYIGQTQEGLKERLWRHVSNARCGSDWYFSRAILKYGSEQFQITNLCNVLHPEDLSEVEIRLIRAFKSNDPRYGYNMTEGGDKPPSKLGMHHSEESRRKMRASHLGVPLSEEHRRNMAQSHIGNKSRTGQHLSEEERAKISAAQKISMLGNTNGRGNNGRVHSAEWNKKNSEAKKRWWASRKALQCP